MASKLNYKAVVTMMNYCIGLKNGGLFLKPTENRGRKDKMFFFVIHGKPWRQFGSYIIFEQGKVFVEVSTSLGCSEDIQV